MVVDIGPAAPVNRELNCTTRAKYGTNHSNSIKQNWFMVCSGGTDSCRSVKMKQVRFQADFIHPIPVMNC